MIRILEINNQSLLSCRFCSGTQQVLFYGSKMREILDLHIRLQELVMKLIKHLKALHHSQGTTKNVFS